MLETDLIQQGFTFSPCGSFTKKKEGIQKVKEYIYQYIFNIYLSKRTR